MRPDPIHQRQHYSATLGPWLPPDPFIVLVRPPQTAHTLLLGAVRCLLSLPTHATRLPLTRQHHRNADIARQAQTPTPAHLGVRPSPLFKGTGKSTRCRVVPRCHLLSVQPWAVASCRIRCKVPIPEGHFPTPHSEASPRPWNSMVPYVAQLPVRRSAAARHPVLE
jgi:hypothetical protein